MEELHPIKIETYIFGKFNTTSSATPRNCHVSVLSNIPITIINYMRLLEISFSFKYSQS